MLLRTNSNAESRPPASYTGTLLEYRRPTFQTRHPAPEAQRQRPGVKRVFGSIGRDEQHETWQQPSRPACDPRVLTLEGKTIPGS